MVKAEGTAPVSVWKSVGYLHDGPQSSVAGSSRKASKTGEDGEASESSRKRISKKKPPTTGIWPCKINGCNKQFAREADLKRHQRTTKTHSMPSFACPQCDASFTRTDALRRHQKARHNGIVIEPLEPGDEDDEGRSRSGTPLSKGKDKETNIPVQTHQGAPTHTGPSSYYRSHTAMTTPHIPRQTHLPSAIHPSSTSIPMYPPSWQNGALPPNMGPIGYLPVPLYYPSPHYRPHTNGYHTNPPHSIRRYQKSPSSQPSTSSNPPPHFCQPPMSDNSNPALDTNLDEEPELTQAEVLAAVQAVLMQAEEKEREEREEQERQRRLAGETLDSDDPSSMDDHDDLSDRNGLNGMDLDLDDGMNGLHGYDSSSFTGHEPMEHMLTEDGEPMLNPAELLTQESLASPPPS